MEYGSAHLKDGAGLSKNFMVYDYVVWSIRLFRSSQYKIYSEASRWLFSFIPFINASIYDVLPLVTQLFVVGSVPLKTYLPDGDIDLTAFGDNQILTDSLVQEIVHILEREEKNEDAEFLVKEVQYIPAEVKIIKCLVENIVVDISFNQLGALCTLCFLEEVDSWISQNHLFKRSIILIKAWCFHESRILGSQHGLISTYALEILVLYIFHVYSSTFAGPLEVLYRFLEFYSKFDWNEYCVSLWGPVPISSLPNMRAEPPRKDRQELLLNEAFLTACQSYYGVQPSCQENEEQPFVSKYFNIIDPLRANNNLGRSISKGNFFRIRSAISFGAQRVMRMLNFPEENLIAEFDLFFKNTWDRHGNGYWIDIRIHDLYLRNSNVENSTCHESEVEQAQASHGSHDIHQKPANHLKESTHMFGTSDASSVSQTWSSNTSGIFTGTMTSDIEQTSSMKNARTDKGKSPKYSSNEVHAMHHFANSEVPAQHSASSMTDNSTRSSSISEVLDNHNVRVSSENQQSFGQISYDWRSEDAVGLGNNNENGHFVGEAMQKHQEEQDFLNITETNGSSNFNGNLQAPVNVNSSNVSFQPPPPHVLASGDGHANSFGVLPVSVPSFESFWGHTMPYSQDLVPFSALQWFPSVGMTLNEEEVTEPVNYNVVVAHLDDEKQMADNGGSSSGNSSWQTSSESYSVDNQSLLPYAFGTPFSFPTMFPIYNVPTETGSTSTANNCVDMGAELGNLHTRESSVISDSTEKFHVSHVIYDATSESFVKQSSDILDGDFLSYWLNLQYGRFCQNERMAHDPPLVMDHDPHLVMDHDPPLDPITPVESVSGLHVPIDQSVAFFLPRSCDGTGAYIPNPIAYYQRYYRRQRARRNQRSHIYERNDNHGQREENWDFNHGDRSHQFCDQVEKPGTNEESHRGEGSHADFNELANFRRDSA
ncbi:uncharacterized protein LOC133302483 [Gastrolobium bilobum]|uniref:uncharacterized protein LOC133302483 n=1 Tax=Gastrolobium bilobum TaxID=150636 RepID=UPI002AB1AE9C|nr:uncharacterized protein LOC133302483 [Gastrolobium bilobum]